MYVFVGSTCKYRLNRSGKEKGAQWNEFSQQRVLRKFSSAFKHATAYRHVPMNHDSA